MSDGIKKLDAVLKDAERIGVIGSPSSTTELALDILGSAVNKKLVGELSLFSFVQEGQQNYAMGQITEIELHNVWHEDPTMRSLIRERGIVNPVSGKQDTHLGQMTVSAVFKENDDKFDPSILGTIPATGTAISIVTDQILDTLLAAQKEEIFYLGNVYGSKPKLPLWFKHFGSGKGGAGEAYHIGIFGKTGSGKSVLAKMIMVAYAKHTDMGIFVLDPQGEFSRDLRGDHDRNNFKLPIKDVLEKELKREIILKSVRELVLDRWDLFTHILSGSVFFERLGIHTSDKRILASEVIAEQLQNNHITLASLNSKQTFDKVWGYLSTDAIIALIYSGDEYQKKLRSAVQSANADDFFQNYWQPITQLFNPSRQGAIKINELIAKISRQQNKPIIVVDLSKESAEELYWTESIQFLVIKRLLDGLVDVGDWAYKEGRLLNSLVVIDEAHRLAPDFTPNVFEHASVRHTLIDASRTTRKYGLGWMFISLTLASIEKEIRDQLRISFFGFGLASGTEYKTLQELAGGDGAALKLYRSFKDPHSSFDMSTREYAFMTMGPVSPLSFSGTPLFLSAFTDPSVFLKANNLSR